MNLMVDMKYDVSGCDSDSKSNVLVNRDTRTAKSVCRNCT